MVTKRIVPCLDIRDGRVVKGVNFQGLQDVSDPVELAAHYSRSGADELVFYDITASHEGRRLFTDVLARVASQIFIPLTVGGGIRGLDDFERVLSCGGGQVSVNSGAIRRPELIREAAKRYGDQCVVSRWTPSGWTGPTMCSSTAAGSTPAWTLWTGSSGGWTAARGEVVVNSIDTDGVKKGFDIPCSGT